jgi:hypothetical protein
VNAVPVSKSSFIGTTATSWLGRVTAAVFCPLPTTPLSNAMVTIAVIACGLRQRAAELARDGVASCVVIVPL